MGLGRDRIAVAILLAALVGAVGTIAPVWGAFSGATSDTGNQISGAPDWVAPTVSASVIRKTQGGVPGYIRAGGTYRVYAAASDTGNPASGVAGLTGNLTAITTGQTAAVLGVGSFTIGGVSYGWASTTLTAGASLTAGTYGYSLTSVDAAGNSRTQSGFSLVVDNTAPTGTDVQTTNHPGGTAGRPELGDTIVLSFSEPIDPNSVISGWTGSSPAGVVVRMIHGVRSLDDVVTVYDATNTAQIPLGSIDLGRSDYVNADTTFGATGTPSTVAVSGNTLVVTLGSASIATSTGSAQAKLKWTTSPPSGATDRAGNDLTASLVTQSGSTTKAF